MFVRLRPDFSAMAAKTHVSDSAVPWRGTSTSYDQVRTAAQGRAPTHQAADASALCTVVRFRVGQCQYYSRSQRSKP